jgi:hypothetical protein
VSRIGVSVLPARYALQFAESEEEVKYHLSAYLEYLHRCQVTALLPIERNPLSSRDVYEIYACAEKLNATSGCEISITATARYWLEEISEMFNTAAVRLKQLRQPT